VLGPLLIVVGGRPVDLGGPRPRRLFAALLAQSGETVSVGTLVDAVWGEDPPQSAVKTLQSYVARLRAALSAAPGSAALAPERAGPESAGVIVTAPPGYRLVVPREAVDAYVFVERIRRARQALDAGEAAAAQRFLVEADALWRGPPYGEFVDAAFGAAAARRLEELRLSGMEIGLDARLLTGRHAEVVAEAEALCATYPLHERFWAQLMIGLYRCGRQADALAAFQRVRQQLAEQVGADPGPELRLLEQQVLQHAAALDAPALVSAVGSAVAPAVVMHEVADGGDAPPPVSLPDERLVGTSLAMAIAPAADRPEWTDSEWADSERAEAVLHRFRLLCERLVAEFDGVILEQTGTGLVAVFGAVGTYDDHVVWALHMALRLRDRCRDAPENLYIGVATGDIVRRGDGSQMTVSGAPVRLAAALCQAAAPGEVLVAERAVRAARRVFDLGAVADHLVAGRPPTRCAALFGAAAASTGSGPPRVSALPQVFVGRSEELDFLTAVYARVVERRRPQIVTVLGDAGIGKSTLVRRLGERLGQQASVPAVLVGYAQAYGPGLSYGALSGILRTALAIEADAPPGQIRDRLAGREALGLTLGLDTAGTPDPRDARDRLHTQWVALAEEIVADTPAVFVMEDLHWAQQPLLDLVADLASDVAGPLLILVTARPEYAERHPAAPGARRGQVLWLDRLTDAQTEALLKELIGERPSPELRQLVLAPADGNPFFVEELLAAMVDQKRLIRSHGGWRLTNHPKSVALPDSVRSVLHARIGCLDGEAHATLKAAAVVGPDFSSQMVERLLAPSRADFAELVDRDFIRRLPGPPSAAPRYGFKHALTQRAAYDELPLAQRGRLHAAVAQLLADGGDSTGSDGTDLDEQVPIIAHHYAEAARADHADLAWADEPETLAAIRDKAVEWLDRAARLAITRFAIEDAVALLDRALGLDPSPSAQARLWLRIAEAHETSGEYPPYVEAMQHVIDASDDPQLQAEAYAGLGTSAGNWWIVRSALPTDDVLRHWLERALELAAPGTPAYFNALIELMGWRYPEELAAFAPQLLAAAEQAGDPHTILRAKIVCACTALVQRRHAEALAWGEHFLANANPDDPFEFSITYLYPVKSFMALGRFAEARERVARNEEMAQRQGKVLQAGARLWRIEVEAVAAEWATVRSLEAWADRAVSVHVGTPNLVAVRGLLLCATARTHAGEADAAAELARRAEELAGGHDDRLLGPRLRLALANNQLERAAALLAVTPPQLKPFEMWWSVELDVVRLDALAAIGDVDGVETAAAQVIGCGAPLLETVATRALGIVHRDPDRLHRAIEMFAAMELPAQVTITAALADQI